MGTATFIKQRNGTGDGRVYRLDPPMKTTSWGSEPEREVEYVWVSATSAYSVETYIFESDADGEVLNWGELEGSFKGGCDHAAALRAAGYEVSS